MYVSVRVGIDQVKDGVELALDREMREVKAIHDPRGSLRFASQVAK